MTPEFELVKALADFGWSAVLTYFIIVIWKSKEGRSDYTDKVIESKDKNQIDITNKVIEVVEDNTRAQMKVSASIDAQIKVGEAQQRALETLTNKVYEVLVK